MNRHLLPVLALLVAASACGTRPDDDAPPAETPAAGSSDTPADALPPGLSTESVTYRVRPEGVTERVDIPFAYRNASPDTLYHPTCRSGGRPGIAVAVQREGASGWESVWHPVLLQCLDEPVVIEPGGVFRDTLRLVLHPQDSVHAGTLTPRSDLEGSRFRLIWSSLLRTYDADAYPFGEEIEIERRVSPPFGLGR